jgi:hypothetical protein
MFTKRPSQGAGRTPTGITPALIPHLPPYNYVRNYRNPRPCLISNRHLVKLKCDVTPTKQTTAAFLIGNRCTYLSIWIGTGPGHNGRSRDFSLRSDASHAFPGVRKTAPAAYRSATQPILFTPLSRPSQISCRRPVTAGQRSVLTGQFSTSFQEPVATQLIISNRSAPRLETQLTLFPPTNLPVLIDTNSDTKFRPATPPAPTKKSPRKTHSKARRTRASNPFFQFEVSVSPRELRATAPGWPPAACASTRSPCAASAGASSPVSPVRQRPLSRCPADRPPHL